MPATFGRRPDGDDQVYLEEDTDDGGFSGRAPAPPQVALALDLDFRDRLTQFPHHSDAVRGGLRGCLGKVLSISRGRLLMGVVGLGLLLAFIVFMVEKTDSRLLDEAKCPDQARVYYPLRTHRRKFSFMFCCHCCALKQPHICYEDMFKWLDHWYNDTLSQEEQMGFAQHVWAAGVVRGHLERKAAPLSQQDQDSWPQNLRQMVKRTRWVEWLVGEHYAKSLNHTLAGTEDYEHLSKHTIFDDSEQLRPINSTHNGTAKTYKLETLVVDNVYAADELVAFMVESGHAQDTTMFRMAFNQYYGAYNVYDELFHKALDLAGVVDSVAYMPSAAEVLIEAAMDEAFSYNPDEEDARLNASRANATSNSTLMNGTCSLEQLCKAYDVAATTMPSPSALLSTSDVTTPSIRPRTSDVTAPSSRTSHTTPPSGTHDGSTVWTVGNITMTANGTSAG
ncbi:protein ORF5 [Cyprinid herpesvirus 3]|nr:protein ORF5 [Cyprinid herpesvirus 3]AOO33504.1 protein ORF5 [Cyprinid herpesvirus 3]